MISPSESFGKLLVSLQARLRALVDLLAGKIESASPRARDLASNAVVVHESALRVKSGIARGGDLFHAQQRWEQVAKDQIQACDEDVWRPGIRAVHDDLSSLEASVETSGKLMADLERQVRAAPPGNVDGARQTALSRLNHRREVVSGNVQEIDDFADAL